MPQDALSDSMLPTALFHVRSSVSSLRGFGGQDQRKDGASIVAAYLLVFYLVMRFAVKAF
jgi:hypothetical protein